MIPPPLKKRRAISYSGLVRRMAKRAKEICRQLRCELVRRKGAGRRIEMLTGIDIDLNWSVCPDLCQQVVHRLPFETPCEARFYGTPVVQKGTLLLEASLPMWEKIPDRELVDQEAISGGLYMELYGIRRTGNPKQATVRFSLCIRKDMSSEPVKMPNAALLATVRDKKGLPDFCHTVVQADASRYQSDQYAPLLFRLTADDISSHLGCWKP